ncbi:unnamed protein product [Gulo gulo]|uniref:Uncharacterized protein n=1 Tax=Gulo gulo TaxID=48420 RepID=A0A9X9Q2F2_GULGU|nr:unnamed protein product [Gulo gulo]
MLSSMSHSSPPTPSTHSTLQCPEGGRPTWIACCNFCLGGNCHSSGSGSDSDSCCSSCRGSPPRLYLDRLWGSYELLLDLLLLDVLIGIT